MIKFLLLDSDTYKPRKRKKAMKLKELVMRNPLKDWKGTKAKVIPVQQLGLKKIIIIRKKS